MGLCAPIFFCQQRVEIDEQGIVGQGIGMRLSAAVEMHQGLHAPGIEIVDVVMP